MDYYSTLGIKQGSTQEEIKKAYRSMAMKHHPDRGGDETTFKKINEAYEFLSDPEKKKMIDMGIDPKERGQYGNSFNQGPFEFHFGNMPPGMEDIFSSFGFGGGFGRRPQMKNKTLSVNITIGLEEVLTGKDLAAEVTLPGSGKRKIVNISIPPGIENGQQIRYQGMGDDHIKDVRPGDLIVNIGVKPHRLFRREGSSLITEKIISVWDALLGTELEIETLDGKTINVKIPTGTQPGTVFSCKNEGLPELRSKKRGNLLINVKVEIPKNINQSQIELIKGIRDGSV